MILEGGSTGEGSWRRLSRFVAAVERAGRRGKESWFMNCAAIIDVTRMLLGCDGMSGLAAGGTGRKARSRIYANICRRCRRNARWMCIASHKREIRMPEMDDAGFRSREGLMPCL